MLDLLLVIGVPLAGFANALRSRPGRDIITKRPYNNRYNDAAGARDNWLD